VPVERVARARLIARLIAGAAQIATAMASSAQTATGLCDAIFSQIKRVGDATEHLRDNEALKEDARKASERSGRDLEKPLCTFAGRISRARGRKGGAGCSWQWDARGSRRLPIMEARAAPAWAVRS
jgi:hypothetical protein